MNMVSNLFGGP
jgi:hypothetical protein